MTTLRSPLRFFKDRSGAAAVEFALVSLIFLSLMVGTVDVARLLWTVNSVKAGTRAAARYAIVNQPAATNLINFDAVTSLGYAGGEQIPESVVGTYTCTSSGCTCTGGSACGTAGVNTTNFNNIVAVIQRHYAGVQAANVVVQYKAVGLGFAGNPFGPDVEPLVTVRLCQASDGAACTPMQFAPGVLQAFGISPFNMPPISSSLSGEDLS